MRARKKPVEIDFIPVSDLLEIEANRPEELPVYIKEAMNLGTIFTGSSGVWIRTLEGMMEGKLDDIIIQGVNGELYPCKPDIFEKTYDKVEEAESV